MADNKNGNGRVTMAVLSTKLDTVIAKLDELCRLQDADHDRIGALEGDIRRVNDRVSGWTVGQSFLTVLASSVAAFLGMRR